MEFLIDSDLCKRYDGRIEVTNMGTPLTIEAATATLFDDRKYVDELWFVRDAVEGAFLLTDWVC